MTVSLHQHVSLSAYYGHAFGQSVVRTSFSDEDADYGFAELTVRY